MMPRRSLPGWAAAFAATFLSLASSVHAEDPHTALRPGVKWKVQLLAPLSTTFSRKGDMVSARVIEPDAFKGAILEGVVRDLKPGATIDFDLVALHVEGKAVPVAGGLAQVSNSRSESGKDDAGTVLDAAAKSSGRFRGGPSVVRLTGKSAHLTFSPGAEFVFELQPGKPAARAREQ